ncbi:MAG TPA: radical SAM protein [Ktedonobacterales bacterium]|jgi:putative pyruvate formate lyase activating enzyme|nr:radical SAM protein [Ktedonobacterales bacterium]
MTTIPKTVRYPGYLKLHETGELARRAEAAWELLRGCTVCPQNCPIDRTAGRWGACHSTTDIIVGSWNVHRREEPPISGTGGAGTIFFGGCQARCSYCQNFWLSQQGNGLRVGPERLAEMMLSLQRKGCHNIDLVTPTHFVPQLLKALVIASDRGLHIPMVYNCAGYEHLHTLKLLDGVIDIYMPDAKYSDNRNALRTSKMHHYVEFNRAALKEMYRQVGGLEVDEHGIAVRGLIVRHLVMPHDHAGSKAVLQWLADELGSDIGLSVMDQYFPAYKAFNDPDLSRRLTWREYREIVDFVETLPFENLFLQEDIAELDPSNEV